MTNLTDTQIAALADLTITNWYSGDDGISDETTALAYIDDCGMDNDELSLRDALANAIAFDIHDMLHNGNDEDLFGADHDDSLAEILHDYRNNELDRLSDAIADKLIARF